MRRTVLLCSSLVLLAVAGACAGLATPNATVPGANDQNGEDSASPAPPTVEWPLSFRVAKVLKRGQGERDAESGSSIAQRLLASTWEFSADGTFVYDTASGERELYPVRGQYRLEDQVLAFSGGNTHSSENGGGSSVSVEGKINLEAEGPVASVLIREKTTALTTNSGGVRSTNQSSVFAGDLLLERVS